MAFLCNAFVMKTLAAVLAALTFTVGAAPAGAAPNPYRYAPCGGVIHQARVFWGLPPVFDRIASRESLCIPSARSGTHDTGAWQINDVNLPWLRSRIWWMPRTKAGGIAWLKNPYNNALAARLLYDLEGMRPWR